MNATQSFEEFMRSTSPTVDPWRFLINLGLSAVFCYLLSLIYIRYGRSLSNRTSLARNFLIVGVTTMPWSDFQGHAHWSMVCWIPFTDTLWSPGMLFNALANVLLFVPFGYLYIRSQPRRYSASLLPLALLAVLLSASAELYQVYSHHRFPTATDIAANLIGAVVGGLLARKSSRNGTLQMAEATRV